MGDGQEGGPRLAVGGVGAHRLCALTQDAINLPGGDKDAPANPNDLDFVQLYALPEGRWRYAHALAKRLHLKRELLFRWDLFFRFV